MQYLYRFFIYETLDLVAKFLRDSKLVWTNGFIIYYSLGWSINYVFSETQLSMIYLKHSNLKIQIQKKTFKNFKPTEQSPIKNKKNSLINSSQQVNFFLLLKCNSILRWEFSIACASLTNFYLNSWFLTCQVCLEVVLRMTLSLASISILLCWTMLCECEWELFMPVQGFAFSFICFLISIDIFTPRNNK
jgi:hypothetical protein